VRAVYCGDHDPVGLNMTEHQMRQFEQLEHAVGWNPSDLKIVRFGLNRDFIDENKLSWIDGL
jgi:hypothetical protein